MNFIPYSYQIQTLFINILKKKKIISWIWKLISCLVVREMKRKEEEKVREEERVVNRKIASNNFFKKKGLLWKNNGTIWRIVLKPKFYTLQFRHTTLSYHVLKNKNNHAQSIIILIWKFNQIGSLLRCY